MTTPRHPLRRTGENLDHPPSTLPPNPNTDLAGQPDHAALIGLALRQCRTGRVSDLVFAHLVKAAASGDPAAHVVMMHATVVREPWLQPVLRSTFESRRALRAAMKSARCTRVAGSKKGGRHE